MKSINYYGCEKVDLNLLLEGFSMCVHTKAFKRIPYSDWTKLKELANDGSIPTYLIAVDGVFHERFFIILPTEPPKNNLDFKTLSNLIDNSLAQSWLIYPIEDGSFGEYLYSLNKYRAMFEGRATVYSAWELRDTELPIKASLTSVDYPSFSSICDGSASNFQATFTLPPEAMDVINSYNINQTVPTATIAFGETNIINNNKELKEKKEMKGINFDFGPVSSDIRMSPYGLAIKNREGTYVSYANGDIINVDIINFNGTNKYIYKIPSAIKDVKVGDVIVHAKCAVFVTAIPEDGKSLIVTDIFDGTKKEILPTKSMFGFDFVTKVVCLFDNFVGGANTDNPFGNMLPFMLMNDGDIDPMAMMLLCGGKMDMTNPMMLYALCGNGNSDKDMLPMFLMMQNYNK